MKAGCRAGIMVRHSHTCSYLSGGSAEESMGAVKEKSAGKLWNSLTASACELWGDERSAL